MSQPKGESVENAKKCEKNVNVEKNGKVYSLYFKRDTVQMKMKLRKE